MPEETLFVASTHSGQRTFISDMHPNERFEGAFSIGNAQLAFTKNGDPYLACLLGDKTGTVPARRWKMPPEDFRRLPTDGFVYAEGRTQPFKGELQLIVDHIEPIQPDDKQMRDLLPCASRPVDEMFDELTGLLGTIQHPAMKALVDAYLTDEMLMSQFKQAPAARMIHHAYLGGLLEHTLQLVRIANAVCPFYPRISRDIVVVGLFLHDLGKTRELSWQGVFEYTDRGELVGHLVEGVIMLRDKADQLMRNQGVRLPRNAVLVLEHIILSHHQRPEYGSVKVPATPEAMLVAMIDDLDAKTTIALTAARPEFTKAMDLGGNFTERNWALGTKVFRPDPLA